MKKTAILLIAVFALGLLCAGSAESAQGRPGYEGIWGYDRVEMVIERDLETKDYDTDVYTVQISWGGSAWEMASWVYRTVWYDEISDSLVCEGRGTLQRITFSDDGSEAESVVEYDDGSARFYFDEEGKLVWENYKEEPGTLVRFEKYDDFALSELYTDEDFDAALDLILRTFEGFDGCELHRLSYASDEYNTPENIAWLNELARANGFGETFTQVMLFTSDFHSPVNPEAETGFEIDEEYIDYQWWLGRAEGGQWQLVSWGY